MTLIKQLYNKLLQYLKEPTVQNKDTFVYTEEQLMARLKFFIGICLSLTLFGALQCFGEFSVFDFAFSGLAENGIGDLLGFFRIKKADEVDVQTNQFGE